jgi:hypothetical protein
VRFEITVPAQVRQGDPVPVALRLVNTGDRTVTLYLQGRPTAFDIIVKNEAGAVVWRRLEGQVVTAILGITSLEPKAALTFADIWPQRDQSGNPVPPGRYSIHGEIATDGPAPLVSSTAVTAIQPAP